MRKYQQFKFREGIPGIDYRGIEGPPSALKEALEEIAEALSFLELGDPQMAENTLGGILERHGLPGGEDHPEFHPWGFQGCKGVRFAILLNRYHRQNIEEREAKEKRAEARRLRALKGGKHEA